MSSSEPYVLVTAAYNEGEYIEGTILSVISQARLPARWVIVSDGSTDDTDAIVARYARKNDFIRLHRLNEDHPRNFTAQVLAINAGVAQLKGERFTYIGNLDSDVTFDPSYFKDLLDKFRKDPGLGLAGGTIHDKCKDGVFRNRLTNSVSSVAHAVQLFRRECFESVGGAYLPLPYGGPDTYAEIMALMNGWQVKSFRDLRVLHHRPTGSAGGALRGHFREGRMDFSLGVLPPFEVARLLKRTFERPYVVGSLARFGGFVYSYLYDKERAVPYQFMEYLRKVQSQRLADLFRAK